MKYVEHQYSSIRLDTDIFLAIDQFLADNNYKGAIRKMSKSIQSMFGVDASIYNHDLLYSNYQYEEYQVGAEVYSKDKSIVILTYKQESFNDFNEFHFDEGLHLTVISNTREKAEKIKQDTGSLIIEFLKDANELTKYQDEAQTVWKQILNDETPEILKSNYTKPNYSNIELDISRHLANNDVREIVKLIATSGSISADDFFSDISKKLNINKKGIEKVISNLLELNGIEKKALVICKKSNKSLTILESDEELKDKKIANLQCATCGRRYKDEVHKSIYSSTDRLRSLTKKSRWLDILVTDKLLSLGITSDMIFWNVVDHSEEVDIALYFKGEVILIELKDKDFETGNAYPLNYRRVKYDASKLMIVTTSRVSEETKSIFQELHNKIYEDEETKKMTSSVIPIYVEGLEKLEESIILLINSTENLHLERVIEELVDITSVNFYEIFYNY